MRVPVAHGIQSSPKICGVKALLWNNKEIHVTKHKILEDTTHMDIACFKSLYSSWTKHLSQTIQKFLKKFNQTLHCLINTFTHT